MALPQFKLAGTSAGGQNAVTPQWPTHVAGDLALLFVETAGGEPVTLSTPAGFAAVANSPQATGVTTAGTQLSVFWCRATSGAMGNPTVADAGNHAYAQILTFSGVIASGDPWDVTGGGVKAAATTSLTVTGVLTTVDDCLIVQAFSWDIDNAGPIASAQTNTNLANIGERWDEGTTQGNGGGVAVWTGEKATAGATGDTTVTVTSSINAFLTIALRPPAGVTVAPAASTMALITAAVTVVLGSIAVSPAASTMALVSAAPTVVLGSIALSPTAATFALVSVNPDVTIGGGGETVAPAAATFALVTAAPTVTLGSLTIAPDAATAAFVTVAPTVVLGSLALTPAAATFALASGSVEVVGGGTIVAPDAATFALASVAPTVTLGSLALEPTAATLALITEAPTVVLGALTLSPTAATFALTAPTVLVLGGLEVWGTVEGTAQARYGLTGGAGTVLGVEGTTRELAGVAGGSH